MTLTQRFGIFLMGLSIHIHIMARHNPTMIDSEWGGIVAGLVSSLLILLSAYCLGSDD